MYEIYEKLRDERGLTDYAVAKKAKIAPATLSAWKKEKMPGGYTPKIDKLCKIADALNVPVVVFLEGEKQDDNG